MAQNSLKFAGMDAFRQALRQLPEDLAQEAAVIVQAQATEAKAQIQRAYPEGPTGNLRRGVTVEHNISKASAGSLVKSRAKHSHLFERGTTMRRTGSGANRGRMPEAPDNQKMVPIVVRRRRAMVSALIDLVRKAGFQVEGQ